MASSSSPITQSVTQVTYQALALVFLCCVFFFLPLMLYTGMVIRILHTNYNTRKKGIYFSFIKRPLTKPSQLFQLPNTEMATTQLNSIMV